MELKDETRKRIWMRWLKMGDYANLPCRALALYKRGVGPDGEKIAKVITGRRRRRRRGVSMTCKGSAQRCLEQ